MSEYKAEYDRLVAQYTQLIDETIGDPSTLNANLPKITATATQLAAVLEEMTRQLATVSTPTTTLEQERDVLLQRLRQIQLDYNGLLQNTDKLETLRRIRDYQDTSWRSTFNLYLIPFFILALVLFLVVLFVRQRDATSSSPMSATTSPSLTYTSV